MSDLAKIENVCELSKTSLTFKREVSKEEWSEVFNSLKQVEGCVQFWIGDCLAYRSQQWGMYEDVADETGIDKSSLRDYKRISESVESATRVADLSYTHHREVAILEPEKQVEFLDRAVNENLSARDLRREIRKDEVVFNPDVQLPKGIFQLFYADPPWSYNSEWSHGHKTPENYYPSMSTDDICDMEINKMTDKNAVLFLWTTSPHLEESFRVVNAWGFQYKTSFIWNKVKHTFGHYSSLRHEILLLCIKGSMPPQNKEVINSIYTEERTEHSKKPEFYYELIEHLYPNTKKIELFSRNEREGWTKYGNQ